MELSFSKYHGCGNDFILLLEEVAKDWDDEFRSEFVRSICDRHTGIGADGCIFVGLNPLEMIYYNQDGTRADMCGNGIRCLAAYCWDEQLVRDGMYDVNTRAGVRTISIIGENPFRVMVEMGKPEWDNEKIGVQGVEKIWNYPLQIEDEVYSICSFYMNTIHTVVFVDEDPFDAKWEKVGEAICHHPMFTQQTNVNFVQVLDDGHIKASTYERGCGPTLACGTGMCAAAVASTLEEKTGKHVDVEMKKGSLHIDVSSINSVCLSGEAALIAKGTYYYDC